MFSNKILGSSSLKGWSLNSCSQLPKITTSLATNQVVTPQRHQIFHLNGPHSEAVVRVGLSTGVASFVPLALERKLHRVWRVPNGKKKSHPQIRTVGTPLAKRTSWWFFSVVIKGGWEWEKTDERWLIKPNLFPGDDDCVHRKNSILTYLTVPNCGWVVTGFGGERNHHFPSFRISKNPTMRSAMR